MQPKKTYETPDLFRSGMPPSRLDQIISLNHPIAQLAAQIDWNGFQEQFKAKYSEGWGRPGSPLRLLVGLHYLKHAFNESDESVLARFLENPYWQYFCGFDSFQHGLPIDSSSLTRFRQRIGKAEIAVLLKELKRTGCIKKTDMNQVNSDTTVQEKAIAFPTDARLYFKMLRTLVRAAKKQDIKLRQSYTRVSKATLAKQSRRYAQAKQYKRARKATNRLKTMLGRVYRDMQRKVAEPDEKMQHLFKLTERLLKQQKNDKHKLYSIHEPDVECISKGKAHKRYEFGVKVSFATTSKNNWIVGIGALITAIRMMVTR